MARSLAEYKAKRDFKKTREPSGKKAATRTKNRFVVHEHHARRLHWDLRLEKDGVLVSWAIPNGIPPDPKQNRLAVHVEDHPLDYIDFQGEIPEGSYGAGAVKIWDKGTYDSEKFHDDEVIVVFHGKKLKGKYVLFQTRGDQWMIHRMDPPDRPRDPMPEHVAPMIPTPRHIVPRDEGWGFEIAWSGKRALAHWQPGRFRLDDADGEDITAKFPEVRPLGRELGSLDAILDGEVVVFGADSLPESGELEERASLESESAIRRRAKDTPVTYVIFDLLYLDGRDIMGLSYEERRKLLAELKLDGPNWQTPAYHPGDGREFARAASERGLPGIMAKRLGSTYKPGKRTRDWLQINLPAR
ncbi:MAG TPA: DNA polymerase ligase N-terminal domain-containing protein [Solirubrobacterales bacterium]|jgi:bifunctional non-homologous end joining protein LigD|nr:DNA polymerase ligase N-terminal domain-containing protein [Solirubrobacterales bacterium]